MSTPEHLPPLQHPQPATRVQFGLGAVLQHSRTPSLRAARFEDEDEDEDENEAPCEGGSSFGRVLGVKDDMSRQLAAPAAKLSAL